MHGYAQLLSMTLADRCTTYGTKKISILKNVRFSGKVRQPLHIYVRKMLISYVKLDHTLYYDLM
jgi:hypothetical protein